MDIPVLSDLVVILCISIVVLFVCSSFRIPVIIGYLLTGMIVGPYGLGGVSDVHAVEILAEIGVVLLLFAIGIEFSIEQFMRQKSVVVFGGLLQTGLSITLVYLILTQLGFSSNQSVFIGFLVALSSTAIVLKLLQERGEINSPFGRSALSLLIFQDIIIIPMLLITPILGGRSENVTQALLLMTGKGFILIAAGFLISKYIFPQLLYQIIRLRNRELFLLMVIATGCGVAYASSWLGLSLGLGAFLAGLIISESEYSHQALEGIIPFRDVFLSFFFVSIGMLLDMQNMIVMFPQVLGLAVSVLAAKAILAALALVVLGLPFKNAIIAGLAISQIGEFSFVLIEFGRKFNLVSDEFFQLFLSVSVTTMLVTPIIIAYSRNIANMTLTLPFPMILRNGYRSGKQYSDASEYEHLTNHLVIIGFGINGRNLAKAAKTIDIPYIICEMNPDTVMIERKKGEPIFYGDATQKPVLDHTNITRARVMVIAIGDASATRRITEVARSINPDLYIIARTRFVGEVQPLHELGANEVIPEEYETAVAIFHRLLKKYLIPDEQIQELLNSIRSDDYEWFRDPESHRPATMSDLQAQITDMEIMPLCVPNDSDLVNYSLKELNIRQTFGLSVMAVRRKGKFISNPESSLTIEPEDVLVVLGNRQQISDFSKHLKETKPQEQFVYEGI